MLQDYLKEQYGRSSKAMLSKINARIQTSELPRAQDFSLPYSAGKYIPDHSRVQAKEHRNVMQILPHILADIDDNLTRLACM